MAFADTRFRIGPGGVEIAQRGVAQAMRGAAILKHIFDRQFAACIGADGGEGGVFADRHRIGRAVDGASAGEYDFGDGGGVHGLQENQAAGNIVAVKAQRLAHRFADLDITGEMHHGIGPVAGDGRVEAGAFSYVAILELAPLHRPFMAVFQIVVDHRQMTGAGQGLAGMAAYITGAAGDQDRRHAAAFSYILT